LNLIENKRNCELQFDDDFDKQRRTCHFYTQLTIRFLSTLKWHCIRRSEKKTNDYSVLFTVLAFPGGFTVIFAMVYTL